MQLKKFTYIKQEKYNKREDLCLRQNFSALIFVIFKDQSW